MGGAIDTNGYTAFEEGVLVVVPASGGDYKAYRFSGAVWAPIGTVPDSSNSFASMHNGILAIQSYDNILTTYRVAEDSVHQVAADRPRSHL